MRHFILILLAAFAAPVFAADTITLDKYFQAKCEDYTGTWTGMITNPTDLYGNGGPWPVTVSLNYQDGTIYGRTEPFMYAGKSGTFKTREIWAHCKDGRLTDIFWGSRKDCGALSQKGLLVSHNMLVMTLKWESAMIGADFTVFAKRKNKSIPYALSERMRTYDPSFVKTCH